MTKQHIQVYIPKKIIAEFENVETINRESERPRRKVYYFNIKQLIKKASPSIDVFKS